MENQLKTLTNMTFVSYEKSIFTDYIHYPSVVAELPTKVIKLLQEQIEELEVIFFTGCPDHDTYIWASMADGDNFLTFLDLVEESEKQIIIIAPSEMVTMLRKEFLRNNRYVPDYEQKGLYSKSICSIPLYTERQLVHLIDQPACAN